MHTIFHSIPPEEDEELGCVVPEVHHHLMQQNPLCKFSLQTQFWLTGGAQCRGTRGNPPRVTNPNPNPNPNLNPNPNQPLS